MTWQEVAALFAQKDVVWFLGPTLLVLAGVILIWVYRSKRNGNGNNSQTISQTLQVDDRIHMLEAEVTTLKADMKYLSRDLDEIKRTSERFIREIATMSERLTTVVQGHEGKH
jgi:hypothetical protein